MKWIDGAVYVVELPSREHGNYVGAFICQNNPGTIRRLMHYLYSHLPDYRPLYGPDVDLWLSSFGREWPQSRQNAAVESPNGIRHLTHDVMAIWAIAAFDITVVRDWPELADTPDIPYGDGCPIDAPDRENDDRENPRAAGPLAFFEYSDDGVGTGVEFGVDLEYNDLGVSVVAFDFDLDCLE
ncbi:hypothetical protein BBO99_00005074 [Phytophthora kernoviae]|uniref:Uncharacterized protein n=2 Tax=Phytophthora kernoviae TaxID=325452 RepID=A0A421F6Z7_9STRA|nr:hypothetical protein G195_005864 [Phytophthora kernoviae 00238/432]KAG2523972.1 hypothetical protein JM16_005157 [Phytophthora kernoviae]KAG2525896.1 hypothetical protein JM18_004679 [Phytophthora kernoviae]RLN26746.1 hypothetical protein BBI17_004275 [Phytophthora kernoviae]RLN79714.1 hypothetical protein BBO99_00005074 [Phytophthora kernoviae]